MSKIKLDRNNTNFTAQLFEYFKNATWAHEYDFLKYYQNLVRIYSNDVELNSRGMLIYHGMGLGKSILAVAIAIDMINERQPIVLLTKSLQENMRGAIHKYVELRKSMDPNYHLGRFNTAELNTWIDANFSFVSMNASNMLKQMSKAAEGRSNDEFDAILEKKFGEVLKLSSLDGKLLIVDEAQNLFRAITNGSANAHGLYDMVMKAKNLKIAFFTGTPISNDPFELVPCFNMLAKGRPLFPEDYRDFDKMFVDKVNGRIKNKEKFQNRIMGLVSHVSHLSKPGFALGYDDSATKAEFPTEFPIIVEYCNMDPDQYVMYQLARDKEMAEGSTGKFTVRADTPSMTKPKSGASSTYRVKSRQLSNYCPPVGATSLTTIPTIHSPKFEKLLQNVNKHPNRIGIVYSQFTGIGGLASLAKYLEQNNWVQISVSGSKKDPETAIHDLEKQSIENFAQGELDEYDDAAILGSGPAMPTVDEILGGIERELISVGNNWLGGGFLESEFIGETGNTDDIIQYDQPPTFDKQYAGCGPQFSDDDIWNPVDNTATNVSTAVLNFEIEAEGLARGGVASDPTNREPKTNKTKKFAVISGEVSVEDRARIKDINNDPNNAHGGILDLILLSSTGAEGLDLKNIGHAHSLEPYWNWGRILQFNARANRSDSHVNMPEDEKTVQPYIYLAIPPESEKITVIGTQLTTYPPTTDTELYNDSITLQITVDSFLVALQESCIECIVNGEKYCRTCNPTGVALYTDDVERDIRAADPCTAFREEKIKAEEIKIGDDTYYYVKNPKALFDYDIFKFDKEINGYRQLRESDPLFTAIIDQL